MPVVYCTHFFDLSFRTTLLQNLVALLQIFSALSGLTTCDIFIATIFSPAAQKKESNKLTQKNSHILGNWRIQVQNLEQFWFQAEIANNLIVASEFLLTQKRFLIVG